MTKEIKIFVNGRGQQQQQRWGMTIISSPDFRHGELNQRCHSHWMRACRNVLL